MCLRCRRYGRRFVITTPITPTEIELWNTVMSKDYPRWLNKVGYGVFMFWHRHAWWDYDALDENGIKKMA